MILLGVVVLLLTMSGAVSAQQPVDPVARGRALIQASRPQEAERVLRQLLAADTARTDARTLVGFLLLERGAPVEAEEEFRNVLAREPGNSSARFGLGLALSREGSPSAAAGEFEKAIYSPAVGTGARVQWILSKFAAGRDDEAYAAARDAVLARPSEAAFHRLLGFFLQLRRRPAEAILPYEQSLEFDPENLEAHYALVSLYQSNGNPSAALAWCERGLKISPNSSFMLQAWAGLLEVLGRPEEARGARERAERIIEAEILEVDALRAKRSGDPAAAEALLRRAAELNPGSWSAWSALGELLRDRRRDSEAGEAFSKAIEVNPRDSRGWLGLASVLESAGKTGEAADKLRCALRQCTAAADIHATLAALHLKAGRPLEARKEVEAALADLPGDPALLALSGDIKDLAGRPGDAIGDYDSALMSDPLRTDALAGKGYALLHSGKPSAAAAAFRRAVEIDPVRGDAWSGLIDALSGAGNRSAAERACRSCLARARGDSGCRERLAALLFGAGRFKEASSEYARLLESGDTSKQVLEGLAASKLRLGEHAAAVGLFEDSLARHGDDPQVRVSLGFLHRCLGNLQAASAQYRRALALSPRNAETALELGTALYLARDYAGAMDPLETAIRLRPDWGKAHYTLALVCWNLDQRALALAHARRAESQGERDASRIVKILTEQLALSQPRLVTTYRRRN